MSDQRVQVSAKDISDLVKSVQDLTLVVTRIAQDSERSRSSQRLVLEEDNWEVIEEEYLPGGPAFPEGEVHPVTRIPDVEVIPQFCLDLAKHRLTGAFIGYSARAERAFLAGRKARQALYFGVTYSQGGGIGLQPAHWIVVQSAKCIEPRRVTSKREFNRLVAPGEKEAIWEQFPSITELQIFCVGLGTPIPPLGDDRRQGLGQKSSILERSFLLPPTLGMEEDTSTTKLLR